MPASLFRAVPIDTALNQQHTRRDTLRLPTSVSYIVNNNPGSSYTLGERAL